MLKDIAYYRRKFSRRSESNKIGLNVSRSAGEAPNKPVLLLSVIELIHRGQIRHNRIELSPELIATFLKLWSSLEIERRADIGLPFFHLRTDGFWHFEPNPGYELVVQSKTVKIRTVSALRQAVCYAYLDDELFDLLQQPTQRDELTFVLIQSWFADRTAQVQRSLQSDAFKDLQNQLLSSGGRVYQPDELQNEDEQIAIVRDGAFRRTVTTAYGYRCAFCGLQVLNGLENIVDGAHIKPFSQFYDDRIDNGLSLCKNHHWAFDRFWFTVNDDYTLVISDNLIEESPHARSMKEFHGARLLVLPDRQQYRPRADALEWHRETFWQRQA